jgi:hypothetical protein
MINHPDTGEKKKRAVAGLRRASPTRKVYFPISLQNATLSMPFESNDFVLCTKFVITGLFT